MNGPGERLKNAQESFKQVPAQGSQFADSNDAMGPSDHEEDAAGAWLSENDPGSAGST